MYDKPIILLVHGAWHRPIHYLNLVQALRAKGYDVTIPANVSCGLDPQVCQNSVSDDTAVIRETIIKYTHAGKDVVMINHSYGGIPGTDAAFGETLTERKSRGEKGGIKAIFYIAAFAIPAPGMSLGMLAGLEDPVKPPHWWSLEDNLAVLKPDSHRTLYNDVDDIVGRKSLESTVPQSIASFLTPSGHAAADISAPKVYISCKNDLVIPFEGQKQMALAAGAKFVELEAGHSPFMKEELVINIIDIVESNI